MRQVCDSAARDGGKRRPGFAGLRGVVSGAVVAMMVATSVGIPAVAQPAPAAADIRLVDPGSGEVVEVVRDGFGVPHVYAETTPAAAYGVGYVTAADSLWVMHVARLLSQGRLVDVLGPIPDSMASDDETRLVGQTRSERAIQIARLPAEVQAELRAFSDGVNQYMDEASTDPEKLPLEFVTFGLLPLERWDVDDTMALAGSLAATTTAFPAGLSNTGLLARLMSAYGEVVGRAKFGDLVRATDPDTPVTVPDGFAWRGTPTGAPGDRLTEQRTIAEDARLSLATNAGPLGLQHSASNIAPNPPPEPSEEARRAAIEEALGEAQRYADLEASSLIVPLRKFFGSNGTAITRKLSGSNAAVTAGPQTNPTVPAVYYEYGVHVKGQWEATGMTIPGLLYHATARTPRHAWAVTNGYSNAAIDWYEERLNPDNPREYWFNGSYEPMECRTEVHTMRGVPYRTQEVCRSRHGPVFSFNEGAGLAYSQRLPWFDREGLSLLALRGLAQAQTFEDAAVGVGLMTINLNILYADGNGRVAYWHGGFFPNRHPAADIQFVQPGDGSREWQGLLPFDQQPHVLNPERGWVANWNNDPARDWLQARTAPATHRVLLLERGFRDGANTPAPITGGVVNAGRFWSATDLAKNLEAAAYGHIRTGGCDCAGGLSGVPFVSALPSVDGSPSSIVEEALEVIAGWDGQAVDRDGDGFIESAAPLILETWIDIATPEAFADDVAAADLRFARPNGELWHLISPDSRATLAYDWLNGEAREDFVLRTFTAAIEQLAASRGGSPASWKKRVGTTKFGHVNHHLLLDLADQTCGTTGGVCPRLVRDDLALDVARIGYVGPYESMNRGQFNSVVAWLDPPGKPEGRVNACSINIPGNSQFLSSTGNESPWFRDQLPLYSTWKWKPFPVAGHDVLSSDRSTCELAQSKARP